MVLIQKYISLALSLKCISALATNNSSVAQPPAPLESSENPLAQTSVGSLVDIFTPTLIQDLSKLLVLTPPKKLAIPRDIAHGTVDQVKSYLGKSLISNCKRADELNLTCVCATYTYVRKIEESDFDSVVYIAVDPNLKEVVVSYRGTATAQNWITDLSYQMVDYPYLAPGIKVHHGFLAHYLATYTIVKSYVIELLSKPEFKSYTLHITGYSLGAAIALISAPNWHSMLKELKYSNKLQIYAYSSPRVGNEKFAAYLATLNIPITRYTHNNDIVTHLLPRSYGFVHAGVEIFENKDHQFKVCTQDYDEDPNCGWTTRNNLSAVNHLLPFGKAHLPPYC